MPIHLACPHCQTALLIPEDCGGRTTKCPQCGDDFVLPGVAASGIATPICAVLAPVEGKVSEADLARAKDALERLTAENVGLQVELARRKRQRDRIASRVGWLVRFQSGRTALDHTVGRGGGFFLAVTLGAAVAMVLFSLFSLSAFGYFFVAVLGMLAAGAAYVPFSYYPDDVQLGLAVPRVAERLAEAQKLHDQLILEVQRRGETLAAAETEYQRLKTAVNSRLHWLRTCQWRQMSGRNFVNFLTQVFEEHGYTVEPTGIKGQVGIDLVVARHGTRVAVAAKGSPKTPLDDRTVQQTHSGRTRYDCPRSALITNAQFLPSARQLAEQLGCRLIDGGQISDLIEGRISL